MDYLNKSEKPVPKLAKDVKAIPTNPLPDKNTSAEIVRRRTSSK
jgi:hypothetical protein